MQRRLVTSLLVATALVLGCDASSSSEDPLDPSGSPDAGGVDPDPGSPDADVVPDPPAADAGVHLGDADECVTEVTAGEHVFTCDGIAFDISIPDSCTSAHCGLILDVHGGCMSGRMEDANTNLRALGREHGYIVIQPNANPAPPFSSWATTDDATILAFTHRVIEIWDVDRDRVHLTGFSQGGFMTWRILCQNTGLFASVAPAAAAENAAEIAPPGCLLSEAASTDPAVDILYMAGTEDVFIDIAVAQAQRDDALATLGMGTGEQIAGGAGYTWTRYQNDGGTTFEYIQHDYTTANIFLGGHCYPGSTDPGTEPGQLFSFACEGESGFRWGEAVIEFFLAHPR